MKKIRIAMITANLEKVGPNHVILNIAKSLPRDGYEVIYVALAKKGWGMYMKQAKDITSELEAAGVQIMNLGIPKGLDIFFAIPKLIFVLRKLKPDVVHSHLLRPSLVARVACGVLRLPNVSNLHNEDHWMASRKIIDRVTHWIDRRTHRFVRVFVAVASNVKEFALKNERKLREDRIVVVNNAVDGAKFAFDPAKRAETRKALGFSDGDVVIGTVARIDFQKDPETFVKMCKEIHEQNTRTKFLWIGEGPKLQEVEALAKELGLENALHFLGQRNDVRELLLALDIFVLTSRFEGLPIALLEAMASRLPVVATAVSGNKVVIQDGQNGFLAPASDPKTLADKVLKLASDERLRETMARAAEEEVRSKYSLDQFRQGYEDAYRRALAQDD